MESLEANKKKIADFLQTITSPGRLNLKFKVLDQPRSIDGDIPAEISVEFTGPDVPLLLARNGELLLSLEHLAAKVLRFEQEDHHRISFDADNFKVLRQEELRLAAEAAVERVRRTGQPYSFSPMSSRERRLLHLALAPSGLSTASSGEGARRFVVLYPEGESPAPEPNKDDRAQAIRQRFRRR
nr:R3H domain protein [uncultured bacterium]